MSSSSVYIIRPLDAIERNSRVSGAQGVFEIFVEHRD